MPLIYHAAGGRQGRARLSPRPPLALVSVHRLIATIEAVALSALNLVVQAVTCFALIVWVVCVVHIYSIAHYSIRHNLNK